MIYLIYINNKRVIKIHFLDINKYSYYYNLNGPFLRNLIQNNIMMLLIIILY